jgi:predicted amidohydrolase YtcJ
MKQFTYILNFLLIAFSTTLLSGCFKGKKVDLIIHNARIHTLNDADAIFEAIAIKDGKIVEIGAERQILNRYTSTEEIDAEGKDLYPGFTDAHGHIMSLVKKKLGLDLTGTRSFDEVLIRIEKYQSRNKRTFIIGRGWDQSLWNTNEMPANEQLNKLYPTTPICLTRVDGHAMLVNDALLRKIKLGPTAEIAGGEILVKEGKYTGILIDNAMNAVTKILPSYSKNEIQKTILEIQNELFQYGITGVHEAGIEFEEIGYFKELIDQKKLQLNIYAMLLPSTKNIEFAKKNGIYTYKNLLIRSFKVFGDGSLGSRGAYLKKEYTDEHQHFGSLTTSYPEMKRIALICESIGYQMNTHAIGDSTNRIVLDLYKMIYEVNKDHRWRIEHAQVLDPIDFKLFSEYAVFPSVQPTHAVSDMRWAETRLGKTRLKGAYAYKTLLNQTGMLAIGTDFPIESFNPFLTIHAAVHRMNEENSPSNGFLSNEAITLEECIKGMTKWAAFASFQENELGTLEKGKDATFTILDYPLSSSSEFKQNYAYMTFIKGKKVYTTE